MSCLTGLLPLLVWVIVVVAVAAIVRIVLNYIAVPPIVVQIATILLWAVVAIACLYMIFDLFSCLLPMPRLR